MKLASFWELPLSSVVPALAAVVVAGVVAVVGTVVAGTIAVDTWGGSGFLRRVVAFCFDNRVVGLEAVRSSFGVVVDSNCRIPDARTVGVVRIPIGEVVVDSNCSNHWVVADAVVLAGSSCDKQHNCFLVV